MHSNKASTPSPFTFGIEEEFFLVHPETRNAVARVPANLIKEVRRRFGELVSPEMLQSQIEISSPVLRDDAEAREQMSTLRRGLAEVAANRSLSLMAAGTHPLAAWREQNVTSGARYHEVMAGFQILSLRNLVCGLHVHVAIPNGIDRIDVMNRALRWLPVFLALSTSSPFWNRQDTGLLSYRQSAYDEWPRSGIPDLLAGETEYETFVSVMQRAQALRDASFLWWAIRPSLRFPTLELRIADVCTTLDDSLALAALFRCLIATLVTRPELGRQRHPHTRMVIEENRWRAKRDGTQMMFIDDLAENVVSLPDVLAELRALIGEYARAFGCERTLDRLNVVISSGTSAHKQREIYHTHRSAHAPRRRALQYVVDWLVEETAR